MYCNYIYRMSKTIQVPKVSFSVARLQEIEAETEIKMKDEDLSSAEKKIIKSMVVDYVKLYYYEISEGNYYFYDTGLDEFQFKDQRSFKKEVSDKLKPRAFEIYFKTNSDVFTVCSRLDKSRVFQEHGKYYINECKGFLHKNHRSFGFFSEVIRNNVFKILQMIKEISCDNNELLYSAYKLYLAQLCRGIKTEVIIYKKSAQGTGKSTETEFLMNYVFGKDICLIANTEPLLKDYNKILLGKLFVVFEELPTFSTSQWEVVNSKLKTLATESVTTYRGLYKEPIQAANISNFVINTNVEGLKNSDGRRIIIMPVSNKYVGNYAYFKDIRDTCFNVEVGEAFYAYMMSCSNVETFYAQRDFPETESKRLAIANLLNPVYKYIKFEYVLKNKGIEKIPPKDFHDMYSFYCKENDIKYVVGKNDFIKKLEEVGIKYRKLNGSNYFRESIDELKVISDKNKWCCAFDEEEEEHKQTIDPFIPDEQVIKDMDIEDYKIKCLNLERRVEELERELRRLKPSKLDYNEV